MPTETGYVGAQVLPLPATNAAFPDPTIAGLLSFFAFHIKEALDPKLGALTTPTVTPAISDACPAGNRYTFDPMGQYVWPTPGALANVLPGLWIWERPSPGAKLVQQTLSIDAIDRVLGLQYIFPQLGRPAAMDDRQGLLAAVERAVFRAVSRGRHPSFAYGSDSSGVAYPLGTPINISLGLVSIDIEAGQTGLVEPAMPMGSAKIGKPANERCLPSFMATLRVREIVEERQPTDADRLADSTLAINIFDTDPAQKLDAMDRVLVVPDDDP